MKPSDPRTTNAPCVTLPPANTNTNTAVSTQHQISQAFPAKLREGSVETSVVPLPSSVSNNGINNGRNHGNSGGRRTKNKRIHGNFVGKVGHYRPVGFSSPPPPPPNGPQNMMNRKRGSMRSFSGTENQIMGRPTAIRSQSTRVNGLRFQTDRSNTNTDALGSANNFGLRNPIDNRMRRGDGRIPAQHHSLGLRRRGPMEGSGIPPPPPKNNGFQGLTCVPAIPIPPPPPPTQHRGVSNNTGRRGNRSDNMRLPIHQRGHYPLEPHQNSNLMRSPPPPPPQQQQLFGGINERNFPQFGIITNNGQPIIPPPPQELNFQPLQQLQEQNVARYPSQRNQQQQLSHMQTQRVDNNINNIPISHPEALYQKQQQQYASIPLQPVFPEPPPRQQIIQTSPQQTSSAVVPPPSLQPNTNIYVNEKTYPNSQRSPPQKQHQLHHQQRNPSNSTTVTEDTEHVAVNWSTHKAPNGANYYYNIITKVSTYERPACLLSKNDGTSISKETTQSQSYSGNKGPISDVQATSDQTGRTEKATGETEKWTEHTDKVTGKAYYYNGVRTTWDKPTNFESPSNMFKKKRNTSATEDSVPRKKRKDTKSDKEQSLYSNKTEAIAAFKGLLLAKDVSPTLKWNDVVRICSSDTRWEACSTMGERKQALAEFQTKRANEIREQKRQEKVRVKEAFMSLLTEVLPNVRAFNSSANTGFTEVRDSLCKDNRFYAVEEEDKREELFYDFVEELRKREERQRRSRKRDGKDALIAFLKFREESCGLTFASTWTSFLASLDDKDKLDKRFVVSPSMSDSDRQLYFADYVIELQAIEDEKRRRIRDARRRAEKAQRDAYRQALCLLAIEGKILPSTRWRNVEDVISSKESFNPINEQDRDAPRDMFEDFVEDWADSYRRDKLFLSRLVSTSKNLAVNIDSQYEIFTKALLDEAAYSPDAYSDVRRIINREEPMSSAKLYFDELVLNAKNNSENTISFGRCRGVGNSHDSSSDEGEIVEDGEVQEEIENSVTKE